MTWSIVVIVFTVLRGYYEDISEVFKTLISI